MIKQTYLTICILLVGWLTSCQEFEKRIDSPTVVDGNTVEVSIATNVPAITVQTRAKATEAEKWLEHVDVLVFKVDGTNETFAYRTTHTNDLSSLDYDNVSIKVKLNISENDEEYRVVFITNLKEEINQLFTDNDEITTSTSKEEVLKQIQFIQDENWVSQENRSRPLPMWGEANATVINSNTTNESFGTMDLLRSIARIELSVSLTDTGTGNTESNGSELFEITSVKVYNVREEGRAVPDKTNITDGKATDPTLIENSDKVDIKYLLTDTDKNAVSGIYVNEAKNQEDDVETSDPLFLVIGAIYKGEDSQNTDVTYYKVGFYDKANNPVDILRNYTYKMFITGVNGPGEEDEEEAAKSSSNSLTVAMLDWSEGEMKHVVFNGQNYLAVSESTLEISKSEATHKLFVQTNYLTGWKAEVLEGGDWITNLDPSSIPNDNNEEKTPFSFKVSENEEEERTGKIRFSCGDNHLALDIHVIQSTQKEYTLTVEIDDQDQAGSYVEFDKTITFTSGYHDLYESKGIDPRILKVTWTPTNEQLHVEFNRYFDWDDDETDITTYEDGYAEITVKPKRLLERDDWYPEAVGDIQLRVGEENGIGQNILIRRRHHEVYLEKADRYVVEANKEYSFKLYSNTSWKIMDPGRIDGQRTFMDMVDYQSINMTSGESTVGNNMEDSGVDIKFKFKNEDFGNVSADVSVLVVFDDLGEEIEKEYSFHIYREADPDSGTRFAEEPIVMYCKQVEMQYLSR